MVTTTSAPSRTAPAWPRRSALLAAVVATSGLTALLLLWLDGSLAAPAPGLPDAGPLVRGGLPVIRSVYDLAAALTVGLLVLAAFVLAPERGSDELELTGLRLRAVRTAAAAATAWLAAGVLLLVLTYADVAGARLGSSGFASQLNFYVREIDLGRSAFVSLVLVMLVATAAGGVSRVYPTGWVALAGVLALWPVALSGHSASSTDHQNAVDSLFVHILGVTVWVGGLLGILLLGAALGRQLASTVRRYSTLAGWCFAAVALSGVVNAWLRLGGINGLATTYGALVLAKTVALVGLGVAGWWQRRVIIDRLDAAGAVGGATRALFVRLATVEVLVMALTLGLAITLARTAPPVPETSVADDPIAQLIGYPMPAPQTLQLLLTSWFPHLVWIAFAGLMAGLYLAGVVRLRRRGDAWPVLRTISWLAACVVLVWSTSGGPAVYGRVSFSGHMTQHMTLMMLVPILMVFGAPILLALRTLRRRTDGSQGPREWLLAALHSRAMKVLTNPIVAAVLFVGSLVAFYYTGLFQLALETHTGHMLMMFHFLAVGYLFVWVLIGVDPGPPHPPYPLRLLLLLATISFHAFFGLALMTGDTVLAPDWWASLDLTDTAALVDDQHVGGGIAWGIGELPTLILIVTLGIQWARDDDREARRKDRQADRDGDAELNAWNEELRRRAARPDR